MGMSVDLVCCMKRNSGRAGLEIKGANKAKSMLVFYEGSGMREVEAVYW